MDIGWGWGLGWFGVSFYNLRSTAGPWNPDVFFTSPIFCRVLKPNSEFFGEPPSTRWPCIVQCSKAFHVQDHCSAFKPIQNIVGFSLPRDSWPDMRQLEPTPPPPPTKILFLPPKQTNKNNNLNKKQCKDYTSWSFCRKNNYCTNKSITTRFQKLHQTHQPTTNPRPSPTVATAQKVGLWAARLVRGHSGGLADRWLGAEVAPQRRRLGAVGGWLVVW